jgi:hypothetical protein
MTARALFISLLVVAASAAGLAQPPERQPAQPAPAPRSPGATPTPTPTPAPVAETRVAVREGQPINVRVDLTITDQRGGNPIFKKTVTVVTADGMGGFIRSTARYREIGDVPLNVDTQPRLLPDGKIRVSVNLQYDLPANVDPSDIKNEERRAGPLTKTSIHENLSLVLESGKPIVAAQSADPVGDRQVTIEVKATILR